MRVPPLPDVFFLPTKIKAEHMRELHIKSAVFQSPDGYQQVEFKTCLSAVVVIRSWFKTMRQEWIQDSHLPLGAMIFRLTTKVAYFPLPMTTAAWI